MQCGPQICLAAAISRLYPRKQILELPLMVLSKYRPEYSTCTNTPLSVLHSIEKADVFGKKSSSPATELGQRKPPSVTKVLSDTKSEEDKLALERWKKKMIATMGSAKFEEYQQGLFRRGSALHSNIESHLLGKEYKVEPEVSEYMKSVQSQLDRFHDIVACEARLQHSSLGYAGVIDCVAHHRSTGLYVIDWKTSERRKTTLSQTYDNPVQVAAYIGMWNSRHPDNQISQGMLVMIYPDGQACDIVKVSENVLDMYWQQWKRRLRLYWQKQMDSHS